MSIKRFSEFLDEFGGRSRTGRSGFGNSDSRKLDLSKKKDKKDTADKTKEDK